MIDCITGGRLITGMVRGIGAEYYSLGANPAFSLERHQEAHDLVVRAWTETGPFAFEGKHYHFEYVNLWPRPYQNPHPPIWCPSQGSAETIAWASHPDRKYTYLKTYSPFPSVVHFLNMYRDKAAEYGYEAEDDKLGWAVPTYVGETDAQAIEQARPHIEALFNKFIKFTPEMLLPPGYLSMSSARSMRQHKSSLVPHHTIESLIERGVVVIGGPDTVRKRLEACHGEVGFGQLLVMMQFGSLPADLTLGSMERFARDVMPGLREIGAFEREAAEPA